MEKYAVWKPFAIGRVCEKMQIVSSGSFKMFWIVNAKVIIELFPASQNHKSR
jgi:hypothetical protein